MRKLFSSNDVTNLLSVALLVASVVALLAALDVVSAKTAVLAVGTCLVIAAAASFVRMVQKGGNA